MKQAQFFTHYLEWEDYQNGLWSSITKDQEQNKIKQATDILINPETAMNKVIKFWPIASKVNLSDVRSNRKSWLGQAACCIESGVPEHITRMAWNSLTEDQKNNANNIAKQVIEKWERDN